MNLTRLYKNAIPASPWHDTKVLRIRNGSLKSHPDSVPHFCPASSNKCLCRTSQAVFGLHTPSTGHRHDLPA